MSLYVQASSPIKFPSPIAGWEILTRYNGTDFELLFDHNGNLLIGLV